MFGCCNNLFSSSCRCNRCCNNNSGGNTPVVPIPTPIFPPLNPPTPPARLRGTEVALTGAAGATIADGAPVPFNVLVSNNTLGVTFIPGSGSVAFGRAGTYLVNWWVALGEEIATQNGDEAKGANTETAFSVKLNGSVVSSAYAGSGAAQISGSSLVTVSSVPSVMQLVNNTGCSLTFAGGTSGQAGLTVTQLA